MAEAALNRNKYHYYEYGNKTGKLLGWQIKKEETDKIFHSIITDDGRSLTDPLKVKVKVNFIIPQVGNSCGHHCKLYCSILYNIKGKKKKKETITGQTKQ